MNKKMPRTPFSTQLSGSAREAEIRIRNIFSGPKKRPPIPLMVLTVLVILLCGNLVSCHRRLAAPTIVMETQYYDSYDNYLEIPALALPAGEQNDAVDAINAALNDLRGQYTPVFDGPQGEPSLDDYDNHCLLYPSTTDRYLNLLFFRSRMATDLETGHILSFVYDLKEGVLVSTEDALALAGLNENALLEQVAEQQEPEINPAGQDYQLSLHDLTLEGFRIKADGQPVFYLTAWVDDVDDNVLDAVSGAGHMYIWEDRTTSVYVQDGAMQPPLVPAEETDQLDPPLWNQWYFAGETPAGGFVDKSYLDGPHAPGEDLYPYNGSFYAALLSCYKDYRDEWNIYYADHQTENDQAGDLRVGPAAYLGEVPLDENTLAAAYEVSYTFYTEGSQGLEWHASHEVLVFSVDTGTRNFGPLLGQADFDPRGLSVDEIIRKVLWRLSDPEVCLFREGYSAPIGPGNWYELFPELESTVEIHEDWDPVYWPGDYWDEWSTEGFTAQRYYSAETDSFSINSLDVTRSDLYTPENIRVGSTRAEVLEAYPDAKAKNYWDLYPGEDMLYYIPGSGPDDTAELGCALLFFFEGDTVRQITLYNMFN